MNVAISPCPNDTFLFYAWISQRVGADFPIQIHFADIENLNTWALEKRYPLIKISFGCYALLQEFYELLPVGTALGFGCGPKLVAKKWFPIDQLEDKVVAIPGNLTTAHLLFNHFLPTPKKKIFCLYHQVMDQVISGKADCALIIHESRFTYRRLGFVEITDLGELWHAKTQLPLPLGGLALHRSAFFHQKERIVSILRESLAFARQNLEDVLPFVLQHSQEKDPLVVRDHIDTYITPETFELSEKGVKGIDQLFSHTIHNEKSFNHICASRRSCGNITTAKS